MYSMVGTAAMEGTMTSRAQPVDEEGLRIVRMMGLNTGTRDSALAALRGANQAPVPDSPPGYLACSLFPGTCRF